MNCPICDMELEMDEKGDGRCDYHRYLSYFTAKDLAQAAVLRTRLIAEAVKDTIPFKRDDCGDVFLLFGDNCMVSVASIRDSSRGPLVRRLLDEWLKSKSVKGETSND